jgi:hypothetical protein
LRNKVLITVTLIILCGCNGKAEEAATAANHLPASVQTQTAEPAPAPVQTAETTQTTQTAAPIGESRGDSTPAETEVPFNDSENREIRENEGSDVAGILFEFSYNGVKVKLRELIDPIILALGEPLDFYEYPSCAFEGIAKMYVYQGFEVDTYIETGEEADRVYSITLTEGNIATAEGLHVGQFYEDMAAIYGGDYEMIPGCYMYTVNGDILAFNMFGGVITSISYYVGDIY